MNATWGSAPATARPRRPLLQGLRVRHWRVRTKLAAVVTIPALAFLGVAGVQTQSSVRQATGLQQFTRQVSLSRQVTDLVHALQQERDHTAGVIAATGQQAGGPRSSGELVAEHRATDRATEALRAAVRPLLRDPAVGPAFRHATTSLDTCSTPSSAPRT